MFSNAATSLVFRSRSSTTGSIAIWFIQSPVETVQVAFGEGLHGLLRVNLSMLTKQIPAECAVSPFPKGDQGGEGGHFESLLVQFGELC